MGRPQFKSSSYFLYFQDMTPFVWKVQEVTCRQSLFSRSDREKNFDNM